MAGTREITRMKIRTDEVTLLSAPTRGPLSSAVSPFSRQFAFFAGKILRRFFLRLKSLSNAPSGFSPPSGSARQVNHFVVNDFGPKKKGMPAKHANLREMKTGTALAAAHLSPAGGLSVFALFRVFSVFRGQ